MFCLFLKNQHMPNSLYDLIDHILVLTEHMSSLLHGSYVGVNYNLLIEQIRYFNGYIGKHRCPNGQRCDHIAARFEYCNHKTIVLSASSAHSRIVSLAINITWISDNYRDYVIFISLACHYCPSINMNKKWLDQSKLMQIKVNWCKSK